VESWLPAADRAFVRAGQSVRLQTDAFPPDQYNAVNGTVLSISPDGSDLKVLVTGRHRIPDGIVVDEEAGHIYWTEMGVPSAEDGSIERADIDGGKMDGFIANAGMFAIWLLAPFCFLSLRSPLALAAVPLVLSPLNGSFRVRCA